MITATEIVDLYLAEVGIPTMRSHELEELQYPGADPPNNPNVQNQTYLYAETLTRLVWDCRHIAPRRDDVLDALAVLKSLAILDEEDERRAAMEEGVQ